jgi:hypothetical protein
MTFFKYAGDVWRLTSYACFIDSQHIQGGAVNRGVKHFFSQYIGLHVILKLILALKSTDWSGLDPWLTIHSILTSFFLAMASRWRRKERHVLRIYTAASWSYSAATGWEVQRIQVRRIWWPICRKPEFPPRALTDLGGVGRRWICRRTKGVFSIRLHPSGPRGPHAVSKALKRCRHWHVRQQKPMFCGSGPQKDVFSVILHPSASGDLMLSQ